MNNVTEMQLTMRKAFPVEKHGKAEASWWAAYRAFSKWAKANNEEPPKQRRIRALWNAENKTVKAWEMECARNAALREARERRSALDHSIQTLESRLGLVGAHRD